MTWSESEAKRELAQLRREHLARMEQLRVELSKLRASIHAEAEELSAEPVRAALAKQAEIRQWWAEVHRTVHVEVPAAIRAVPADGEFWDASFHQVARVASMVQAHPAEFVADVFREEEPITRRERRETLAEYARQKVKHQDDAQDPLTKLMARRMVQAAREGTGMSFTKPDGTVVEMTKERIAQLSASRFLGKGRYKT